MNGINLLLVEDNEGDIFVTLEAFEESKIISNVVVKTDGALAINYFKETNHGSDLPNLVLLDINLPKVSGHEVLKYLKQHDDFKSIPVIMFTTSSSKSDIKKAYQNDVNCFITKPMDSTDYLKALSKIEDFWLNIASIPTGYNY